MPRSIKELVGASTSVLILGVLGREPSYGYQIVKRINEEAEGLFTWQEGTVYPLLHKLEKEGLVRSQWQEAESGRERKYYYITPKGRGVLREDTEQWRDFNALVRRLAGVANA